MSALPAAELAVRLAEAYLLIGELTEQAGRLTAQAERLSARVEELERQARKDSSTSSRPPSSDSPYKKKGSDRSLPFFLYGLSEEGGRDDVDESLRACRSSSSTRAASRSICAVSSPISRYASASRTASSAAGRADSSSAEGRAASDTTGNDHH